MIWKNEIIWEYDDSNDNNNIDNNINNNNKNKHNSELQWKPKQA